MNLHVAVVHTADGIRFLRVGRTAEEVDDQLALYVGEHARDLLWPDDNERVARLLDDGRVSDAIAFFFSNVGDRWDSEFLHRAVVDLDAAETLAGRRLVAHAGFENGGPRASTAPRPTLQRKPSRRGARQSM